MALTLAGTGRLRTFASFLPSAESHLTEERRRSRGLRPSVRHRNALNHGCVCVALDFICLVAVPFVFHLTKLVLDYQFGLEENIHLEF